MNEQDHIHLIIDAMSNKAAIETFTLINTAISQHSESAHLHFLMAAMLSEEEKYDDAIHYYKISLDKEPGMNVARFQFGLLLATLEQDMKSLEVLQPLAEEAGTYYQYFARGVIDLIQDKSTSAHKHISRGVELNHDNASLNYDMKGVLNRIEQASQNHSIDVTKDSLDKQGNFEVDRDKHESKDINNAHLLDVYQSKH